MSQQKLCVSQRIPWIIISELQKAGKICNVTELSNEAFFVAFDFSIVYLLQGEMLKLCASWLIVDFCQWNWPPCCQPSASQK